ncbi:hypothetical protein COS83_05020 [archaeon CG07_land_8_20_14_0_80_38_8]|nr:MAG: hypothetical protein COS83_05020 [archaeon CG07_land_8_20_14_0_80_38_8]
MNEEIIKNAGAVLLKIRSKKIIVISDLHLSDETTNINSLISSAKKIVKNAKADLLIVAGDLFNFGMGGEKVDNFEKELSKVVKIVVLRGNHDHEMFPPLMKINDCAFMHGDYDYAPDAKHLIMGHTHPYLKGKRVFLKGVLKDNRTFTILPPFNPEEKGPEITSQEYLLGFIFRKNLIKKCNIHNLEGKLIGELVTKKKLN